MEMHFRICNFMLILVLRGIYMQIKTGHTFDIFKQINGDMGSSVGGNLDAACTGHDQTTD